jgi:uncharacterized membrane protein YeaQ/YmgE (transglycosylase-associated protein family)
MEMHGLMDLGGGVGIIGTIVIGGLAGWIAEKLTNSNMGLIANIVVGILGSLVGGILANALNIRLGEMFHGWFWGNLLVSIAGAVVLIVVFRAIRGRSA